MKAWTNVTMFAVTVLLVFTLCAMQVMPVRADDGTPPPTETPTASGDPPVAASDSTSTTLEASTPTPDASVTAADSAASTPTEDVSGTLTEPALPGPDSTQSSAEGTIAVDLSQIPDGTGVVVLDETGATVPLATQEAADIASTGDPMWCPSGVTPGAATCSGSYSSLSDLVAGFVPTGNGTIWIQAGPDPGSEATIDGSGSWSAARNFSLTLLGGWAGCSPTCTSSITGVSTFDTAINIVDWTGSVTVKNIAFEGVPANSAYSTTAALNVANAKGSIALDNVSAHASASNLRGAWLDNLSSSAGAPVTVTNSIFTANTADGLTIQSAGAVTLKNVTSDSNTLGVYIHNDYASGAKPVTITNGVFTGNNSDGLSIYSNGAVTLNNISADFNLSGNGATITNNVLGTVNSPVTLKGFNDFSSNGGTGLLVTSDGLISLSNVTANGNGIGVSLDNTDPPGTSMPGVTILGYFGASSNTAGNGLKIKSKGPISAANLTLLYNAANGVYADNSLGSASQPVTISGVNTFGLNSGVGLWIVSHGAVTLSNVTADNDVTGAQILNTGGTLAKPVTMTGVNTFNGSFMDGLSISSAGAVTLSNVTASENQGGFGISIHNTAAISLLGHVTVSGNKYGLIANSTGAVTVNNLTALGNDQDGAVIHNFSANPALQPNVSLVGPVLVSENGDYSGGGLTIVSYGAVTMSNVTADGNASYGVWITNYGGAASRPVTITGTNSFNGQGSFGLKIESSGAITLSNVTADRNMGYGALLWTRGVSAPQSVTLTGTNTFNSNGDSAADESGLIVNADGNIIVSNLTASYNYASGAILDNYTNWAAGPPFPTWGSVTVNGFGNFVSNTHGDGLYVNTHGSVTLNRVAAVYNGASGGDNGIEVHADHNITLVCSSAWGNWSYGLQAGTPGMLTIKGFISYADGWGPESLSYGTLLRSPCP
jgi:parallel beta helix pectate lyase-like protein